MPSGKVLGVVVRNVKKFLEGQNWFWLSPVITPAGAEASSVPASPAQPVLSVPDPHLELWTEQPSVAAVT